MLLSVAAVLATSIAAQADTVVTLRVVERDLTGDGRPEVLRLVGVGPSLDSLGVTFSIQSSGRILFADDKFMRPDDFTERLRRAAPGRTHDRYQMVEGAHDVFRGGACTK